MISVLITFLFFITACSGINEIQPPYKLGNNPMNASHFGFVAEDQEWIYYVDVEQDHIIARTNGEITETYENTYGKGINLYGDYIYYEQFGDDGGLYRVHKDKQEDRKKIAAPYVHSSIIVSDYIFYALISDNSGVYRTTVDGKNTKQLAEGTINHMQWSDGWIYYAITADGKVLRMSSDGKNVSELITEDGINISTTNFIVVNDWIYFENRSDEFSSFYPPESQSDHVGDIIYRMKLDGTKVEALEKGSLHYSKDEKHIFFSSKTIDWTSHLYRMNLDGSNQIKIHTGDKHWSFIEIHKTKVTYII